MMDTTYIILELVALTEGEAKNDEELSPAQLSWPKCIVGEYYSLCFVTSSHKPGSEFYSAGEWQVPPSISNGNLNRTEYVLPLKV